MSQIPTQKDDNRSGAASDFVQVDQPNEMPGQQEQEAQQQQSADLTGSTRNFVQALKAELMDELKDEFGKMLSTQSEQHLKEMAQLKDGFAKEMAQLESKNQKLEEKVMSMVEVKNELEEIIQQKMEKFREEVDKNGQQAQPIGSNLSKSKILANPTGIVWDESKTVAHISECGLNLKTSDTRFVRVFAIATEGYAISGEHCRKDSFQFPGTTIVYYYEVAEVTTNIFSLSSIGFTDGSKPPSPACCFGVPVGGSPNSYGITGFVANKYSLLLSGKEDKLECPTGVIAGANVVGCGLLLNSKNELAVFFTLNGVLLGKQIRINPTVDRLYPTMFIWGASVEANFGDNLVAKPFQFDTDKCPGLVFE